MAKIHCDLTYENEKVTYAKIIENQAKELVKSLLNNTEFILKAQEADKLIPEKEYSSSMLQKDLK